MADDDRAMKPAKALFGYSLLYLFMFTAYLGDVVAAHACFAGSLKLDRKRPGHLTASQKGATLPPIAIIALAALVVVFTSPPSPSSAHRSSTGRFEMNGGTHMINRRQWVELPRRHGLCPSSYRRACPVPPPKLFCQVTG